MANETQNRSIPGLTLLDIAHLIRSIQPSAAKTPTTSATMTEPGDTVPVEVYLNNGLSTVPSAPEGSQTSNPQAVSEFHHLCQERGMVPVFEYDEPTPQIFSVKLKLGSFELDEPARFRSKKAAKEAISARAIPMVPKMPRGGGPGINGQQQQQQQPSTENWVGKLLEFYQQHPSNPSFFYKEFSSGIMHGCQCILGQRPDQPFGNSATLYSSKKAAKAAAAKEAYDWLRENNFLGPDPGSLPDLVTQRGGAGGGQVVKVDGMTLRLSKYASAGQKVNG